MRIDYLKQKFKHKDLLIKFILATFFIGLSFRLLFPHSSEISPILQSNSGKDVNFEEPNVSTQQDIIEDEADDTSDQEYHTVQHSINLFVYWLIVDFVSYFLFLFFLYFGAAFTALFKRGKLKTQLFSEINILVVILNFGDYPF